MGVSRAEAERAAEAARRQHSSGQAGAKPDGVEVATLCLTPAAWAKRDIPPQDRLLGDIFSTTTRSQLSADTGLGKTLLGIAIAYAIATGRGFLAWRGHRAARVLIIDGEMPGELIKARLAAGASWFGLDDPLTEGFYLLSREDVEDMPPLDSPVGATWMLDFIAEVGGVDFVIFDNIASLTASSLKEEDGEHVMKDFRRELTKRRIGQLWLHHTGHDSTRAYGTKMREWHLDTVMVAEKLDRPDSDVAFTLKFPKARRRTPDNRQDFDSVEVTLAHGQWTHRAATDGTPADKPLGRNQRHIYNAATKLLAGRTGTAPNGHPVAGRPVVSVEAVKSEAKRLMACEPRYFASRFSEAFNALTADRRLNHYDGWVWK